ncbi:MAG: hypothetical protein HUU30_17355, partial [Burkholderiaceae bacterium]|nr:hypothetical protein [Burkholderiaceae bacterium]
MATLRSQIIAARQRCRTGTGGSVLDHLCSATGMSAVELAPSLQAEGGVGVLLDDDQPRPDFTVLEPQRARAWRCALIAPAADGTPRV